MKNLARVALTEEIHVGASALIYNGYRLSDGAPIAVKLLRSERPSPHEIAKLKHEFAILRALDTPYVVKAYELIPCGQGGAALVMEKIEGRALSDVLRDGRLDLKTALSISAALSDALSVIHERHVIHKDLKPHNILVDIGARRVKLVDFGISTRLSQETPRAQSPDSLEGTLAYMSPEQTGRMNRVIDHRADLYSLGATMYQMLTGALPFSSSDPMELVHSHIARTPAPPRELSDDIPEVVSAIVMKLLSKAAEDRYQRAAGLKADLDACLADLSATGHIAPFELGQRDTPTELRPPQTLYGREAEIEALMQAWERATLGAASLVLVSGYAGVGKSALVSEIQKTIARERGYFIAGKFDQLNRSVPYASVAQALRELVRQILTEREDAIARWRESLQSALGSNGQLLITLIPELEVLLGPQPSVQELGPSESQNRWNLVFQSFFRAISAAERPLAVFLDDLHWADPASLKLLQRVLTDKASAYILVIGAYRDNEVDAAHPLSLAVGELRSAGATVSEIRVEPLSAATVGRLVKDALSCDAERAAPLAALIFEKTHGNPFFVIQFLQALHEEKRISFDERAHRFTWDLERVKEMTSTDNVVDLLVSRIERLAPATRRALRLAACIGHQFDLRTLAVIHERSPAETAADLWEALLEGLVLPTNAEYRYVHEVEDEGGRDRAHDERAPAAPAFNVTYKFLHDRVQQAAYSLIEEDRKQEVHLRIGRLLLSTREGAELEGDIFGVVNHLNVGAALVHDAREQEAIARLNLAAGRRAKASAAYEAAAGYFGAGAAILGAEGAAREEALSFDLCAARAECEHLAGAFEEAEAQFHALLRRSLPSLSRAKVHRLRMDLATTRGKFADAVSAGLEGLALLGVDLRGTAEAQQAAIGSALAEVPENLAGRRVEDLIDAPALTDSNHRAALEILSGLLSSAYIANPTLFALSVVKQVNLSLKYGHSDVSAAAYAAYGVLLSSALGRPPEGHAFGKLAVALDERQGSGARSCDVNFIFAFSLHYVEHVRRALEYFVKAREIGLAMGNFIYSSYACFHAVTIRLSLGDELSEVQADIAQSLALMQRTKDAMMTASLTITERIVAGLTGRTKALSSLEGDGFDEASFLAAMDAAGLSYVVFVFYLMKLQVLFLHEDYQGARAASALAEERVAVAVGPFFTTELTFYTCLTLAALASEAAPPEKERLKIELAGHAAKIEALAAHGPDNYAHKHLLVQAEIARIGGDEVRAMRLYDEAIAAAEESGFLRTEALANELCAKFHLLSGRPKPARPYMTDALQGYLRWGATAKADDIKTKYLPSLLPTAGDPAPSDPRSPFALPLVTTTTTTSGSISQSLFDAAAAVAAAQTIAGEILLDNVVDRLMRLILENAGAQRGVLLLDHGGELRVEATINVDPREVRVGLSRPVEEGDALAMSIVQYVARTREPVVLDDATESRFVGDAYIEASRPKSILCQALTHQGRLTGVLYLENNAARRAFTQARLALCGLLSSQAAIAVENALLHARLQGMADALKRSNEKLEEEVADRTEDLRQTSARLERELADREQSDAARAALQEQVIRAQKARIEELSTPLIPISDRIMVLPLVGSIDEARAAQVLEAALSGAQSSRAAVVILDITGVKRVDAGVASSLVGTAAALRLLGTSVVLTGISPEVARTLTEMDVDLGAIVTRGTLQSGIAYALTRSGEARRFRGAW
jgi:predicted ATPase/anti-anti-sigma regulatory factor